MFGYGINSAHMYKELNQSLNGIHINFKMGFFSSGKGKNLLTENFVGKYKCSQVLYGTLGGSDSGGMKMESKLLLLIGNHNSQKDH